MGKVFKLADMKGGWIVGDFKPSVIQTHGAEVCCRFYKQGDTEEVHAHAYAQEITVVLTGAATMGDHLLMPGDMLLLEKGEWSGFHACEDTWTVVVKVPSVPGDKCMLPASLAALTPSALSDLWEGEDSD